MTPQEEFDYFDVVIHNPIWWIDGHYAAMATFNRRPEAANDD